MRWVRSVLRALITKVNVSNSITTSTWRLHLLAIYTYIYCLLDQKALKNTFWAPIVYHGLAVWWWCYLVSATFDDSWSWSTAIMDWTELLKTEKQLYFADKTLADHLQGTADGHSDQYVILHLQFPLAPEIPFSSSWIKQKLLKIWMAVADYLQKTLVANCSQAFLLWHLLFLWCPSSRNIACAIFDWTKAAKSEIQLKMLTQLWQNTNSKPWSGILMNVLQNNENHCKKLDQFLCNGHLNKWNNTKKKAKN